jgi:gluconate 2-dehydrogenase gamma chain
MIMTDEQQSRRSFLARTLVVIPSLSLGGYGLADPESAQKPPVAQPGTGPAAVDGPYQPEFFSNEEWDFIQAACDQLIPDDDLGPGAIAAGVPEFIDRQMQTPYGHGGLWYMQGPFDTQRLPELGYQLPMNVREIYRAGIEQCNQWCVQKKGVVFAQLGQQEQIEVLKGLQGNQLKLESFKGSVFMSYLIANTQEGYFSDPLYGGNKDMVGWKMIGFPGARADFMDWIDHPNETYPLGPVSISGSRG